MTKKLFEIVPQVTRENNINERNLNMLNENIVPFFEKKIVKPASTRNKCIASSNEILQYTRFLKNIVN